MLLLLWVPIPLGSNRIWAWSVLEIAVFGLLGLLALRIVCEVLLVFFKTHETATRTVALSRISTSLADEVRDAISDIADHDAADAVTEAPSPDPAPTSTTPRRTARRAPPPPKPDDV
jgi:hypothetical protein